MQKAGADIIHVDVMDGKFVPPVHYSTKVVEQIAREVQIPVEAHLMVAQPWECAAQYARAGAKRVLYHVEAGSEQQMIECSRLVKGNDAQAGIAINTPTPLEKLTHGILQTHDIVLVMSVNPGWAGQSFVQNSEKRIAQVKQKLASFGGLKREIEVDGGINDQTAHPCIEAVATCLVTGSHLFNSKEASKVIQKLKKQRKEKGD